MNSIFKEGDKVILNLPAMKQTKHEAPSILKEMWDMSEKVLEIERVFKYDFIHSEEALLCRIKSFHFREEWLLPAYINTNKDAICLLKEE